MPPKATMQLTDTRLQDDIRTATAMSEREGDDVLAARLPAWQWLAGLRLEERVPALYDDTCGEHTAQDRARPSTVDRLSPYTYGLGMHVAPALRRPDSCSQ